jgi:hypothetical protein
MKSTLISRVKNLLLSEGVLKTTVRAIRFPINRLKRKSFRDNVLSIDSNEERFTWIYENNYWGSKESASGFGSTLKCTQNLRRELPGLFERYSIRTVFDAPCGDFNWMQHLLATVDIDYVGGDIVKPLISNLNKKYKREKIRFVHFDLIKYVPPTVDLMICRVCLFHLSFADSQLVLEAFLRSNTSYLLTSTHRNNDGAFANRDILTGDFRLIDLLSKPFGFPPNPLATIEDWIAPDPERVMSLWSRDQISKALIDFEK